MKIIKPLLKATAAILVLLFLIYVSVFLYYEDDILLRPEPLPAGYTTTFPENANERFFQLDDGITLHALHLTTPDSQGVVFYNHGNSGNLLDYLPNTTPFLQQNYDVLIYDYRGYGQSEGEIRSEQTLYDDARTIYSRLTAEYDESQIIVVGYSLGSGIAAHTACVNQPQHLILNAPYDDIIDLFPLIPHFLSRIHLNTGKAFENCSIPSTIFHGRDDELGKPQALFRIAIVFNCGFLEGISSILHLSNPEDILLIT